MPSADSSYINRRTEVTGSRAKRDGDPWASVGQVGNALKFEWQRELYRARLGLTTTAVGVILSTYADLDGTSIYPSFKKLAEGIGMDRGTFSNHAAKLVELGVLKIHRSADGQPTVYHLVSFAEAGVPLCEWDESGRMIAPGAADRTGRGADVTASGCGHGSTDAAQTDPGAGSAHRTSHASVKDQSPLQTNPIVTQASPPMFTDPEAIRLQALAVRRDEAGYWDEANKLMEEARERQRIADLIATAPDFD
jgi:hypothetical protein